MNHEISTACVWLVYDGACPICSAMARPFDLFGTDKGAFFMEISGTSPSGDRMKRQFDLVAGSGHGPIIPCVPAIVVARMLAEGRIIRVGATACIGLIGLEALLQELKGLDVAWQISGERAGVAKKN